MTISALPFADLIETDELSKFEKSCVFLRRRVYTPAVTLKAFLSQTVSRTGSCQEVVNQVFVNNMNEIKKSCSQNTSSYCRARKRLSLDAIKNLAQQVNLSANKNHKDDWLWKKRKVSIIDGTSVSMSDTMANLAEFPKRSIHHEYNGYPISRSILAASLETGTVIDFNMAPWKGKGTGELPLAATILDSIEANNVLIGDAMFVSFSFIGLCRARNLDFMAPQKSRRLFKIIEENKLSEGDRLIKIKKPRIPHTDWISEDKYNRLPDTMILRETHITIAKNGFRTTTVKVISTLIDHHLYSKEDLSQLLLRRWNIELDLKILKRNLGIDFLKGKSPDMVRKEIWMNILAFNLVRRLINAACFSTGIAPRKISFNRTLNYYLNAYKHQCFDIKKLPRVALKAISQFILPEQKNRFEPRAKKSLLGQNDYRLLSLSRLQWKLIQIYPFLQEEIDFSSATRVGMEMLKAKIPLTNGKPAF